MKEKLEQANISILNSSLEMIPKTYVTCSNEDVQKNTKLLEWLENLEDVDAVFHNMENEA